MKKLVVWYNPNKNTYYYRVVRGFFYERYEYKEGSINNYGHVIVLVIPVYKIELITLPYSQKTTFLDKCSSFLKL